jgi:hypothetical protein
MERIKMQRSVWWPIKLKQGQTVSFQGKTYKVVSQTEKPSDSWCFRMRYYTSLIETEMESQNGIN